jgi:hypothetical protein
MTTTRSRTKATRSSSSTNWQELSFDVWFRQFDDGRNLDLSAFEHVAIGANADLETGAVILRVPGDERSRWCCRRTPWATRS